MKAAQTVVLLLPVICLQGGNKHWVFERSVSLQWDAVAPDCQTAS